MGSWLANLSLLPRILNLFGYLNHLSMGRGLPCLDMQLSTRLSPSLREIVGRPVIVGASGGPIINEKPLEFWHKHVLDGWVGKMVLSTQPKSKFEYLLLYLESLNGKSFDISKKKITCYLLSIWITLVSCISLLYKLLTAEQVTFIWLKLTLTISFITLVVLHPPWLTGTYQKQKC